MDSNLVNKSRVELANLKNLRAVNLAILANKYKKESPSVLPHIPTSDFN
ncbi:hypothetical protein [Coxiella burnetii]|nr:hypothetical protein [Coxiella burnetii]